MCLCLFSTFQCGVNGHIHSIRPEAFGDVFEKHGGLSPHHGHDPCYCTHVFPQAIGRHHTFCCPVCKFTMSVSPSISMNSHYLSNLISKYKFIFHSPATLALKFLIYRPFRTWTSQNKKSEINQMTQNH